jgi:hypothetical protein
VESNAARVPVLAHYTISHSVDSWERGKVDQPLIGRYSSSDPKVMRLHIRWAQQAGIDGFIVHWRKSHRLDYRLKQLARIVAEEGFKLALFYRGLDSEGRPRSVQRVRSDLELVAGAYGQRPEFELFGRPLVIWKGCTAFTREQLIAVTESLGDRLLVLSSETTVKGYQRVADLVSGNAPYWPSLNPHAEQDFADRLTALAMEVRAHRGLWIAPATPGYGRLSGSREIDRLDGQTLRRSLELATDSGADAVAVASWNHFGDNTHVEPSGRFGLRALEVLGERSGGVVPRLELNSSRSVPALAYYYIWFERRSWGKAKRDTPLLGPYSSDQREVMRRHLQWARQAGLDGFIVSWKSTDKLNRRLEKLAVIAAELGGKLAVIYQGLDFQRNPRPLETVLRDLTYFADTWSENQAFDLFEKPVVIWNGTWKYSQEQIERVSRAVRSRLLLLAAEKSVEGYQRVADLVDGNAYYWSSVDPYTSSSYAEKLVELGEAVHARGGIWFAPATTGYDARLIGGSEPVDRRDGETLRRTALAAALSQPDALGVISWNEFSENTHLEPSRSFGTRYLEVLSQLRGGSPDPKLLQEFAPETDRLVVRSVPALPDLRFLLNGKSFLSNAEGVAEVGSTEYGSHELEVEASGLLGNGTRWRFKRWERDHFDHRRTVSTPMEGSLQAGFELTYPVSFRFEDDDGGSIDPSRIARMSLRDGDGVLRVYENGPPRELVGNRLVRRLTGLESLDVSYSLESVEIDGSNVVSSGKQRITPARDRVSTLQLRLYPARFRARDHLFGFGLGSGIRLQYPDGSNREFPFSGGHDLEVPALARGLYRVEVLGAGGIAPPTLVSLSRPQEIVLPVISYLDLAVILLGAAIAAATLLRWGRPELFKPARLRKPVPEA